MGKNTNKSLKLIKPIISKRIIAFLLNILVFGACSLALYFATLYGVFATGFNYIDNQNYINEVKKDNFDEMFGLVCHYIEHPDFTENERNLISLDKQRKIITKEKTYLNI